MNRAEVRARDCGVVVIITIACIFFVFGPQLLTGKILAIGDGRIEALPAFLAPMRLWDPAMFLGYPLYADSSQAAFYPLRLLRFVPGGFNAYVLASYAIAAAAVFGYLVEVLHDRTPAIAGAASFALGGFMLAHFGHPMIDHPAAWSTVALWTLARYGSTRRTTWLAGTAVALALSLSSGQPQIVLFAIVLLGSHSLVNEVPLAVARRSIGGLVACASAIALGIALGAAFVMPAIELGAHSTRASLPFPVFAAAAIPLEHLALRVVFPFAIGGGAAAIEGGNRFPDTGGGFTETTLYVCVAAIALAIAGIGARPRPLSWFWAVVTVYGIALAAGAELLPLAGWIYEIPPFNAFRLPGRHAYEITLGISILSAFGIARMREARRPWALIGGIVAALAVVCVAVRDIAMADSSLFHEPAIICFGVAAIAELLALGVALCVGPMAAGRIAAGSVVAGALAFASVGYWRDAPPSTVLERPAYAEALRALPMLPGQRVSTYSTDEKSTLRPNLPDIWDVPEAAGYTPLRYPRIDRFLRVAENGQLLDLGAASIDLAAIRYVAVPREPTTVLSDSAPFAAADLGMFLAGASAEAAASAGLGFSKAVVVDRIAIVSALGASVDVVQGTTVATIVIRFTGGREERLPLRAGVDTAELASNRPEYAGRIRHRQPPVFSRDAATTWFVSSQPLRIRGAVRSVEIRLAASTHVLNVRKVSLVDGSSHRAYAFTQESRLFADGGHFRHLEDVEGTAIFENLRAYPRAWVESTSTARRTSAASVTTLSLLPQQRELTVDCATDCALVSAYEDNGDWRASIDGTPAPIASAHDVLVSVRAPRGRHRVVFTYVPGALTRGLVVSGIAALCIVLWMLRTSIAERSRARARAKAPLAASVENG